MAQVDLDLEGIPHGHGLTFKKGVADGLLDKQDYAGTYHQAHDASYRRGQEMGRLLRQEVAGLVRD